MAANSGYHSQSRRRLPANVRGTGRTIEDRVFQRGGTDFEFGRRELFWRQESSELVTEYAVFSLANQLFLLDAMPAPPDRRSFTMIWDMETGRVLLMSSDVQWQPTF